MAKNVAVIGSGNWATCIARICAKNALASSKFNNEVRMWVFDEIVDGEPLSVIINKRHENVKCLPSVSLPSSLVATPDLPSLNDWADILVFVLPHHFLVSVCSSLQHQQQKSARRPGSYAVSLIKGIHVDPAVSNTGGVQLLSDLIRKQLGIECAVLMGANSAHEVAQESFSEATVGCRDPARGQELKALFQTTYFRIGITPDEAGVELCGALKDVVATAAGFCDGLIYGDNTKAAVIRLGLMEMIKFIRTFYGARGIEDKTFFESCGIADLITNCYVGRNRRLAEAFVKTGKSINQLESEMFNGQKLQGPQTAAEVYTALDAAGRLADYPLMTAVHVVCEMRLAPERFIDMLRHHPEHA